MACESEFEAKKSKEREREGMRVKEEIRELEESKRAGPQ